MKLLMKIRLMVLATWLMIIAIVVAQSYFIALKNYSDMEVEQIAANYQRVTEALQRQQEALNSFTGDWAHWSDTYRFMQKKFAKYIRENLSAKTTFREVGLNYILYFDNKGAFYEGRAFNLHKGMFYPVSPLLLKKITNHPVLTRHDDVRKFTAGFIAGNTCPIMITSYPVTNNEMVKTPNGNIMMGFDYDSDRVHELGTTIRSDIRLFTQSESKSDAILGALFEKLSNGAPYVTTAVNNETLFIYAPLKDIDNQLLGMFRINMPRTTWLLGLNSIFKSIAIVIFSGIIIFLMLEFFIKKIVLDRLFTFKRALNDITTKKDFNQRIPVEGQDEIADLVEDSNKMLAVISLSQTQLMRMAFSIADTNKQLGNEIKAREAAETELATLNSQMIIASRRAGMADVASSVLHNIGNTLNSVNVSVNLIHEKMTKSELDNLPSVARLLELHQENLGDYLVHDPKGKQIPAFILMLADKWQTNKNLLLTELDDLIKNLDLVKEVIASQQGLSKTISMKEHCNVSSLVDDALFFCKQDINAHAIIVNKEFADVPSLYIDRIKVLQILVNLVKNAIDALASSILELRVITVRIKPGDASVIIEISDNGNGIREEDLASVFSFGFTTKKNGHGIGLHGSCNSAQELGGKLSTSSAGIGKGATFTLTLPYQSSDMTGETIGRNKANTSAAN